MTHPFLSNLHGLRPLLCLALPLVGGPAAGEDKPAPVAKGAVGKLLPIPDEYKAAQVVAYFTLDRPEGKVVGKAKAVVVTVYKDAKVERVEGGKRVPAKAAGIKPGQRIELYDLEEGVQIGDSLRLAPRSVVLEEQGK